MEFCGADVPVYFSSRFQGYLDEYEARKILSRKEGTLVRDPDGSNRRIVIHADETASRVRSLSGRDACGGTVSPTYVEELYSGSKKDASAIVTGRCYSMKKMAYKGSQMVPFREGEGFARKRFNPDTLPVGLVPARRNDAIAASWQS